jgi:hypothetical protein
MDISRPDIRKRKLRRNVLLGLGALLGLALATYFILRLKPAIPTVDSAVWTDTVKRGPLLRQVRGPGSLVPREDRIRLVPAETEATVVRIRVLPGAHVEPDTIVMDLVDPELQQQLLDAQLQLQAAKADYKNTQAKLQSDLMTQRAGAATVGADQEQAQLQAQTDKSLYDLGVISGLSYSALNPTSQSKSQGLWTTVTVTQPQKHPVLSVATGQIATPRSAMTTGPYIDWRKTSVPAVPPDTAFLTAGTWQLQWRNPDFTGLSNVLLQLDYAGDIGRLQSGATLLDDNFFNGSPWQIGLKRWGRTTAGSQLTLKVLPMPAIAPIYLDPKARDLFDRAEPTPKLIGAKLIPEYESILTVAP